MKGFNITSVPFSIRIILGLVLFLLATHGLAFDLEPPKISDITIKEIGDDSATITWKTDDDSDSLINYGLSNDYGIVRDPLPNKKDHEIILTDLEQATTYHFRVVSADEFGNQTVSGDFTLTTGGVADISDIEKVEDEKQQTLVAKAFAAIEEITDPEALVLVADKLQEVTQEIILPPSIIGIPRVEEEGEDYAIVSWLTDRETNSEVSFVSDAEYDPFNDFPYIFAQSLADDFTTEHRMTLIGLEPSTTYHFQVSSEGEYGLIGKSEDATFTTTSIIPILQNIQIIKVEETSATFSWNTTVPAAGYVEYTNMTTGEGNTTGSPELVSGHIVRLSNLVFGTTYSAMVWAENAAGDKVRSEPRTFVTIRDEEPPIISKVTNESTLYPSADNKIQTIVSWGTDEKASCQLFYRQGLSVEEEGLFLPKEKEPTTEHVQVVVEFLPSTVYKFWLNCEDEANNKTRSEDFVLFTPEKEKSIIDIILENFEGTFGWVKNIGK